MIKKVALCAIAAALSIGTAVYADNSPPTGITRNLLQKADFPGDKYVTQTFAVDIEPGKAIKRHYHPGIEMTYIAEGDATFSVEGQPAKHLVKGDSIHIPAEVPHEVQFGSEKTRLITTYVTEKDKPLAIPVPAPAAK